MPNFIYGNSSKYRIRMNINPSQKGIPEKQFLGETKEQRFQEKFNCY